MTLRALPALGLVTISLMATGCMNQGHPVSVTGTLKSYPFLNPIPGIEVQAIELPKGRVVTTTSDSGGNYQLTVQVLPGDGPWLLFAATPGNHALACPIWPSASHGTVNADLTPGTSVLTNVLIQSAGGGPRSGFFALTSPQRATFAQSLGPWNPSDWMSGSSKIDGALGDPANLASLGPDGLEQLSEGLFQNYQTAQLRIMAMDHRLIRTSIDSNPLLPRILEALPAALGSQKGLLTAFGSAIDLAPLTSVEQLSVGPDSANQGDLHVTVGLDKLAMGADTSRLPGLIGSLQFDVQGEQLMEPVEGQIPRAYLSFDSTSQSTDLLIPALEGGAISVTVDALDDQGNLLASATANGQVVAGQPSSLDMSLALDTTQFGLTLGEFPTPAATF